MVLKHALQEHILSTERPCWSLQQFWADCTCPKEANGEDTEGEAGICSCGVAVRLCHVLTFEAIMHRSWRTPTRCLPVGAEDVDRSASNASLLH